MNKRNHEHSVHVQHSLAVFDAASTTASMSGTTKIHCRCRTHILCSKRDRLRRERAESRKFSADAGLTSCVPGGIYDGISEQDHEHLVPVQHSPTVFEAASTTLSASGTMEIQCQCRTHILCSRRHRRRHQRAEPCTLSANAALTHCVRGGIDNGISERDNVPSVPIQCSPTAFEMASAMSKQSKTEGLNEWDLHAMEIRCTAHKDGRHR